MALPTLTTLPSLRIANPFQPHLLPVDSGGGDTNPITSGDTFPGDTSSGGGGGSITPVSSGGSSSSSTSTSSSCGGIFSFINPLCSIERFAIFIIGLICIAGAIYLFKPTSQIIAGPLNAAKEGIKTAASVAPAAVA